MGELALGEAEGGGEVLGQVLRLLDGGEDGLVDLLLVRRARLGQGFPLLGLAVGEELLLGRDLALLRVLRKVRVADLLVNLTFRSAIRLPTPYSPSKLNPQGLDVNE